MDFLTSLGGGVGIAALVGIAVNARRFWQQSIADGVAREMRHLEMMGAIERQTEALSGLAIEVRNIDGRLVRVEEHAKVTLDFMSRSNGQ